MSARLIFNIQAILGPQRCQQRKSRECMSVQAHTIRVRRLVKIHRERRVIWRDET
ncbi:hypothetical protein ACVDG5_032350 [Mesorhizobium sp. ORM6]